MLIIFSENHSSRNPITSRLPPTMWLVAMGTVRMLPGNRLNAAPEECAIDRNVESVARIIKENILKKVQKFKIN